MSGRIKTSARYKYQSPVYTEQNKQLISNHLMESCALHQIIADRGCEEILTAVALIADTFQRRGKLLLCGNGGSAADAQHMAAEFVSRLSKDFNRPGLPALALTTDTSFITAYANDFEFDGIFERQVQALGQINDGLIGISTSGNSANVIRAVVAAKYLKMRTIGLVGEGGELGQLVDCVIVVPSRNTQYIQECLLSIEHILCELVELLLFGQE